MNKSELVGRPYANRLGQKKAGPFFTKEPGSPARRFGSGQNLVPPENRNAWVTSYRSLVRA